MFRKSDGTRPLGRLDVDWMIILKSVLKEQGVGWVYLAQKRTTNGLPNTIINLRAPKYVRNFLTKCATISFSRTEVHGVRGKW